MRSLLPVALALVACAVLMPGSSNVAKAAPASASAFPTVERSLASNFVGMKTDDEVVEREEEAINPDGLSGKERRLMEEAERYEFQAEVSRLMDIIINSLYTHKEIFLRELISNASDALDKIRFISLADDTQLGEGEERELEIRVSYDKEERTLSIRDRGVGMTKQDLINHLGTVARSGTSQFLEAVAHGADMSLIGQFGVGFYSVYLVADKVRVTSKNNDDEQYIWESTADQTFEVAKDPRGSTLGRGTEVKLWLKEDASEFLDQEELEKLIKRYSEFITFPIYLYKSETKQVKREELEAEEAAAREAEKEEGDEELGVEEEEGEGEEEEEESKPEEHKPMYVPKTTWSWVHVNDQPAIWTRDKSEISKEEYRAFYKAITKDSDPPLTWSHFKAEGEIEFRAILYVPKTAPFDLYDNYYGKSSALRLYVRKVLISDSFEDLMPRYLSFIRGVVDSDDLPLNVSRETLQQHKVLKVMGKKLVRKSLEMLRNLAQKSSEEEEEEEEKTEKAEAEGEEEEEEKAEGEEEEEEEEEKKEKKEKKDRYATFWKEFGKNLKLGVLEDSANKSKLARLLRFQTTKSKGKEISLDKYVARMKSWQDDIYYIAGESLEELEHSAFLERMRHKDIEVLLLTDPVDEYVMQNLIEYEDHRLQSVTKEGLRFGDESDHDRRREEAYKKAFTPLADWLKEVYGDAVEKVTVSNRVTNSPAVLVTSQFGYSANMERIMRNQAFSDQRRSAFLTSRKIMEINPRHPIIAELKERSVEAPEDEEARNLARLLLDVSLLNSGFDIQDVKEFSSRMLKFMASGLSLESMELLPEMEVPEEEEDEEEEMDMDEMSELEEEEDAFDDAEATLEQLDEVLGEEEGEEEEEKDEL